MRVFIDGGWRVLPYSHPNPAIDDLTQADWEALPAAERVRVALYLRCKTALSVTMACVRAAPRFTYAHEGAYGARYWSERRAWQEAGDEAAHAILLVQEQGVDVENVVSANLTWERLEEWYNERDSALGRIDLHLRG